MAASEAIHGGVGGHPWRRQRPSMAAPSLVQHALAPDVAAACCQKMRDKEEERKLFLVPNPSHYIVSHVMIPDKTQRSTNAV